MKKGFRVRNLITLTLCLLMCFTALAPVSTLAKCAHKYTTISTTKEPTCTKDGKYVVICENCGKHLKTKTSKAFGHKFVSYHVNATCTKNGEHGYKCARCGYKRSPKTIKMLGHNYDLTIYKATCTTPKFQNYKCKRCGHEYTQKVGKALGHKWSQWKIDAKTLIKKPVKAIRTCSRCKKVERKNANNVK